MRAARQLARVTCASILLCLGACLPTAKVIPLPGAVTLPPKPENCAVELFENETPQRSFEKLAEVHVTPTATVDKHWEKEVLRKQACAIGADAVIELHKILRGPMDYTVVGTAVRYAEAK